MTKEELIGRKFNTAYDETTYTIKNIVKNFLVIYEEGEKLEGLGNTFSLEDCNKYLSSKTWELLPLENKMYKTPKGIEYGIGTQFISSNNHHEIVKITPETVTIKWIERDSLHNYPFDTFASNLDNWDINIINNNTKDYKQVDPRAIKFDFTNTKIKVNNEKEAEWVIKASNNESLWVNTTYKQAAYYTFYEKGLIGVWASRGDSNEETFAANTNKEITIQDILNNMKEVIEVGDIVTLSTPIYGDKYEVLTIDGDNIKVKNIVDGSISSGLLRTNKLVSKGKKKEIIGYETVVDLPGIPKGSKTVNYNKPFYGFKHNISNYLTPNVTFHEDAIQDTKFFKPIYKQDALELKFSKYTATLSKENGLVFSDGDKLVYKDLQNLLKSLNITFTVAGYKTTVAGISNLQVGCKSFNEEDIKIISGAIKQLDK